MDIDELKIKLAELLKLPNETEWVEFKKAGNSYNFEKLGRYFSALSNEANLKNQENGWLIFGVDNQHKVVGTLYRSRQTLDRLKGEIAQHTTNNLTFQDIHELVISTDRVILFQIPPAPRGIPTAWKGHYYGRNGEELGALNIQEMEQIRKQAGRFDQSKQICPDADFTDLEPAAIARARSEYKKKNPNIADEVDNWDDTTFLNKAKVTIDDKITRTAIILLGKSESEHFLSPSLARMTWLLKDEEGNIKDYEHFTPPFIISTESLFLKIRNLKYRYLPDGALFPTEINKYEPYVIREALHNCIAHQDYEQNQSIVVEERPDELVFANAGAFMPGNIEKVIQENRPQPHRNPFLAGAMFNLGMIDIIGSGIVRMFTLQKERFFPLPEYDLADPNKVFVKIFGKVLDEKYTRVLMRNPELDLVTVIMLDKIQKHAKITKEEHRLLKAKGLVEGRYPNLFVASRLATTPAERAKYIRYRAFDDKHYKDMVLAYIRKYGEASRSDIDNLLAAKLPDMLNKKQKRDKISNLLYSMSKRDKVIHNRGSRRKSSWVLSDNS